MSKYLKVVFALLIPIYMFSCAITPTDWHFIDNADLIFHEAWHTIFFFLPQLLGAMAGSFMQLIVPLIIVIYFIYKREYISSFITLSWAGQSLVNISVYVKDAVIMQLPLLGGDSVYHDWNYILSSLGLLKWTSQIGSSVYLLGVVIIFISIILTGYYSYNKFVLNK